MWWKAMEWKAKDYFNDPKVIALCKAIDRNNLKKIDRLVTEGVDVNTKGKDNMTPLLWAFGRNRLEPFKKLLEHGADPNVKVTSNFNTEHPNYPFYAIGRGDTVLLLAAQTGKPDYLKYIMQHGGDPNVIGAEFHRNSLLMIVVRYRSTNQKECIQILMDAGADLDYRSVGGHAVLTALEAAGSQYDVMLQLLEAGASFHNCNDRGRTFIHRFLEYVPQRPTKWQEKGYTKVLEWLEANGADIEGARKDIETWHQGNALSPERIAELQKRSEDELAAKRAAREKAAAINK